MKIVYTGLVGDIVMDEQGPLAESCRQRFTFGVEEVGDHHVGALGVQPTHDRCADAACAASHQGGTAVKRVDGHCLLRSGWIDRMAPPRWSPH